MNKIKWRHVDGTYVDAHAWIRCGNDLAAGDGGRWWTGKRIRETRGRLLQPLLHLTAAYSASRAAPQRGAPRKIDRSSGGITVLRGRRNMAWPAKGAQRPTVMRDGTEVGEGMTMEGGGGGWRTSTPAWPWRRPVVEKKGRGREMRCSQARWGLAAARDFDPSSDLPLCNFGPSPFLLFSQEGPFLL